MIENLRISSYRRRRTSCPFSTSACVLCFIFYLFGLSNKYREVNMKFLVHFKLQLWPGIWNMFFLESWASEQQQEGKSVNEGEGNRLSESDSKWFCGPRVCKARNEWVVRRNITWWARLSLFAFICATRESCV